MKCKCYIAGAITGCDNYQRKFEEVCAAVTTLGLQPVNPVWLNHKHNSTWADFMRVDISALMTCTHIYCLPCWRDSRSATIEHNLAKELGIIIIYAV